MLPDEIDPNRNLGAAFSDSERDTQLRKNFKLARLIKVSKFMLKHGRAPKFKRSKRDTVVFSFNMRTGDENAMHQQLASTAKQIQNAIKKRGYGLDVATEQISEGFEVDVPRIKIDVKTVNNSDFSTITMSFGFPDDEGAQNKHMTVPRLYWDAGIPVDQPEDRIIAYKKRQVDRFNKPISQTSNILAENRERMAASHEGFPYGSTSPNFKIEKDKNGVERYFVQMSRYDTDVIDWLRNAIWDKTLGLGKMNDYMITDAMTGKPMGLDPKFLAKDETDERKLHSNEFENITGEPK